MASTLIIFEMNKKLILLFTFAFFFNFSFSQTNPFNNLKFALGEWTGTGNGFGNNTSTVESSFNFVMNGKYVAVKNESHFKPTEKKPKGEHHIDNGFISYDRGRKAIVFRQFHIEGFYNQYVLNQELSTDELLVFETEFIENFVPNGKTKWTLKKVSDNEIETYFDLSTGGEFIRYGTNKLKRKL